jgi:hypothetical protein
MTLDELLRAIDNREDVEEASVSSLLASSDRNASIVAAAAIAKTAIRKALEKCAALAAAQDYADQGTLAAVERLAGLSDIDEPYIETLKGLGIQAAAAGRIDQAMALLQNVIGRAAVAGQRRDQRSRRAMRFTHDIEIDRAVESLAKYFQSVEARRRLQTPLRLVLLCSAVRDEDGPTVITVKRAQIFQELGYDVSVISTELASSAGSRMAARLAQLNIPFTPIPPGSAKQRMDWLLGYANSAPANAVIYLTSLHDNLGKLASCIRLAPVQAWDSRGDEPLVGQFDLVNQTGSILQETVSEVRGRRRCNGRRDRRCRPVHAWRTRATRRRRSSCDIRKA